ncbi:hypothetical protein LCGC14_0755040 [marine sediment metagenome]|uniref:Uncharacterized protein n=1 Tax=marine sediment metagenome TaxID=412755 RepID=A0A0F9Q2X3_9ZZZZ
MPRRQFTTKQFIQKAQEAHGGRYDYSLVRYTGTSNKVTIVCEEHGSFEQQSGLHLNGQGCMLCTRNISAAAGARFVNKAKAKHGDRYDYSRTKYTGAHNKVTVACREHGPFTQQATGHLAGKEGCLLCRSKKARRPVKSQDEVVQEFKEVHGDKYDYSQVEYTGCLNKVIIICDKHGIFEQVPTSHRKGHGCRSCAVAASSGVARSRMRERAARRPNTRNLLVRRDHFVSRAREVHGNRYDYSHVVYTTVADHVDILCDLHGVFSQRPQDHTRGSGCPTCGINRRRKKTTTTTEAFVTKAEEKHGRRYDYSKIDYQHSYDDVLLGCTRHGWFGQTPHAHLQGHDCPQCAKKIAANKHRMTRDKFIEKATDLYAGKYRYVEWNGCKEKAVILCPIHGEYSQTHEQHLKGYGCAKCAHEQAGRNARHTTDDFIQLATKVHGSRYDYSKVDYQHSQVSVVIGCPQHGLFDQGAKAHLAGHGCPACSASKGEVRVARWLNEHNIFYMQQWMDHDCIAIERKARFDFWLPNQQTIIEYDGAQHFRSVPWFCGAQTSEQATLEKIQTADRNKDAWAAANDVMMLRIRYDEDVTTVLDRRFLPLLSSSN